MAKLKYFLLFFVLVANIASAQKNIIVYYTKGTVKIISGSTSAAAKRGDVITKDNSLQIGQDGDCMLIAEKGKSLQVKTPVTYSFQRLQQMLAAGGSDETSKFFSYVYDNMFTKQKPDQMGITPVVFRGDVLMKTPGDNTIVISDELTLTWKPAGKIPIHLIVKNGDKIITDTFFKRSTSLQLDLTKYSVGHIYEWKAEERDTRQPKEFYYHFLLAEKKDCRKIMNDLKFIGDKLSPGLKDQMRQDIFMKWKQLYSQKVE